MFGLPANVPPFFTLTKCDADFDRKKDGVTLLPNFHAFGCECASRIFLTGHDDALPCNSSPKGKLVSGCRLSSSSNHCRQGLTSIARNARGAIVSGQVTPLSR